MESKNKVVNVKVFKHKHKNQFGIVEDGKETVAPVYPEAIMAIKEFSYFERLNTRLADTKRNFLSHKTELHEIQRVEDELKKNGSAKMKIILL